MVVVVVMSWHTVLEGETYAVGLDSGCRTAIITSARAQEAR